jgi:hypothetical protein
VSSPIGRLSGGIRVDSTVTLSDTGEPVHRYVLVGGPDDGRAFETLAELMRYVTDRHLHLVSRP